MTTVRLPRISGAPQGMRRVVIVVMILAARVVSPVYIPKGDKGDGKSRVELSPSGRVGGVGRSEGGGVGGGGGKGFFKDDSDVTWYLKIFNRKLMIWRCKNAIQTTVDEGRTLPLLDLTCNVIGKLWSIAWYHGNDELVAKTGVRLGDLEQRGRYSLLATSHVDDRGHSFSNWINIRLRIQNATTNDSGLYHFVVTHWDGPTDRQRIYVDIVERKSKRYNHLHQPHHPKGSRNAVDEKSI